MQSHSSQQMLLRLSQFLLLSPLLMTPKRKKNKKTKNKQEKKMKKNSNEISKIQKESEDEREICFLSSTWREKSKTHARGISSSYYFFKFLSYQLFANIPVDPSVRPSASDGSQNTNEKHSAY
jgi:hypothetical protein